MGYWFIVLLKHRFDEGTQASQPATRLQDAQFIIAGKMPAYPTKPMVKNAIKREQSQLVRAMPSVSILGEANGQWLMFNGQ